MSSPIPLNFSLDEAFDKAFDEKFESLFDELLGDYDHLDDDDDDDDSDDPDYNSADDVDDEDQRRYLDDSNNPFFPVTLNPKERSQLRIPSKVITDYGLNFPESITIVDPLVNKFGTLAMKIKIGMDGCVFVKGYGAILRRNNVKPSDKMICELKRTGDNNLVHTIKFHIITR